MAMRQLITDTYETGSDALRTTAVNTLLTVAVNGKVTLPAANGWCVGTMLYQPKGDVASGDGVTVATMRSPKLELISGGAIAAGDYVKADAAGKAVSAGSNINGNANTHIVAKALTAVTGPDQVFTATVVDVWSTA